MAKKLEVIGGWWNPIKGGPDTLEKAESGLVTAGATIKLAVLSMLNSLVTTSNPWDVVDYLRKAEVWQSSHVRAHVGPVVKALGVTKDAPKLAKSTAHTVAAFLAQSPELDRLGGILPAVLELRPPAKALPFLVSPDFLGGVKKGGGGARSGAKIRAGIQHVIATAKPTREGVATAVKDVQEEGRGSNGPKIASAPVKVTPAKVTAESLAAQLAKLTPVKKAVWLMVIATAKADPVAFTQRATDEHNAE